MKVATLSDLALLAPELILVSMALVIIVFARRLKHSLLPLTGTVVAAVAAGCVTAATMSSEPEIGFGGMLTVDGYARFFKLLIAGALALAAFLAARNFDDGQIPRGEYHALLLLASTGMMLAVSTADLLTLYLGLELMTICSYILVGLAVDRPTSNEAAIKYFLAASFASALLLFGISLTYGLTGSTEFSAIAASLTDSGSEHHALVVAALGLVTAGLAFKVAAVPFHAWAPDAYQGATAPVAAFLASGSKAAGLAALGRVCVVAFGPESELLSMILAGLAALSIMLGSLIALSQTDMRRLLAYSSISHAGYALCGLVAVTPAGISATMTYAFFYVFMTLGAFGVVIAMGKRGETVDGFKGLAGQNPLMAAVMLLFLLALTGLPPTAGFMAKFGVILNAVRAGRIELAVLAVACSVISAFVYLRVAVNMYMSEPGAPKPSRVSQAVTTALVFAAVITLLGGVFPGIVVPWAVSP